MIDFDLNRRLFIVSAPSGAGKTTLNRLLVEQYPKIEISRSYTSRPMRRGEVNGVDYWFIDEAAFEERIAAGDMLEWARVHGNLYGTSKTEMSRIYDAGRTPLLEIDVQGCAAVQSQVSNSISVFILPPDLRTLWDRLAARGTDDEQVRWRRLVNARDEIKRALTYPHFIINTDREKALGDLVSILIHEGSGSITRDEGIQHCHKLLEEFEQTPWLAELAKRYLQP